MIKRTIKKVFTSIVRQVSAPFNWFSANRKQSRIRGEVKKRIREGNSEWSPKPKVFGIGLSRTGTSSLCRALQLLGYEKSLHWKKNGKVLGWPEFFYADAATDLPCSVQFEALYYTFEKSKFVYTVRDIDDWEQSIRTHLESKYPNQFERPSELRKVRTHDSFWARQRNDWRFHNAIQGIKAHEALYAQYDSWEEAYYVFDRRVRRFFEDKLDDEFLEMNITEGDGWDVLCPFLGCDVPNQPFPHLNKTGRDDTP